MDLIKLSKQERFYFDVGEAMSMNNMRSFINIETMEVEIHPSADHFFDDEEDIAEDAESNPDKFIPVETASSREAFIVMEDFVDTIADPLLQQRLSDAINGRKPFANFNNLVHTTSARVQWFDFKNMAYIVMAKQWIEENASNSLKEKIKALPAVHIS
ncbi:MAG: UPF0158 family protein [Chitinophagaceae bacterium]|nr:UPF0158 family protein [Chitinophagaceae bacterium]